MSTTDTLIEQCESILKEIETSPSLIQGPALQVINHAELANIYLSPKAKSAISKEAKTLTHRDETGGYICIYLGAQTRTDKIEKAVEAICESLNRLAEQDLIHSCLAPPSSLILAKQPMKASTSAVIAYVLVPFEKKKEAEELAGFAIEDGGCGTELMSLEADLAEDEFFAEISVSHFYHSSVDPQESLQKQIQQIIDVLPGTTEVVEVTDCSIITLSTPYEVRFRNPLMKDYKEVRINYTRECVKTEEGKITQFNLLREVEYIRKDDK